MMTLNMLFQRLNSSMGVDTLSDKRSSVIKTLIALHMLMVFFSLSGVCSKSAAGEPFFSPRFCLFYGGLIVILGIYAIAWQQVIKRLPLSLAYANKAIGVVWTLLWGCLIFHEIISVKQILGAVVVITGIIMYSLWSDYEQS